MWTVKQLLELGRGIDTDTPDTMNALCDRLEKEHARAESLEQLLYNAECEIEELEQEIQS